MVDQKVGRSVCVPVESVLFGHRARGEPVWRFFPGSGSSPGRRDDTMAHCHSAGRETASASHRRRASMPYGLISRPQADAQQHEPENASLLMQQERPRSKPHTWFPFPCQTCGDWCTISTLYIEVLLAICVCI